MSIAELVCADLGEAPVGELGAGDADERGSDDASDDLEAILGPATHMCHPPPSAAVGGPASDALSAAVCALTPQRILAKREHWLTTLRAALDGHVGVWPSPLHSWPPSPGGNGSGGGSGAAASHPHARDNQPVDGKAARLARISQGLRLRLPSLFEVDDANDRLALSEGAAAVAEWVRAQAGSQARTATQEENAALCWALRISSERQLNVFDDALGEDDLARAVTWSVVESVCERYELAARSGERYSYNDHDLPRPSEESSSAEEPPTDSQWTWLLNRCAQLVTAFSKSAASRAACLNAARQACDARLMGDEAIGSSADEALEAANEAERLFDLTKQFLETRCHFRSPLPQRPPPSRPPPPGPPPRRAHVEMLSAPDQSARAALAAMERERMVLRSEEWAPVARHSPRHIRLRREETAEEKARREAARRAARAEAEAKADAAMAALLEEEEEEAAKAKGKAKGGKAGRGGRSGAGGGGGGDDGGSVASGDIASGGGASGGEASASAGASAGGSKKSRRRGGKKKSLQAAGDEQAPAEETEAEEAAEVEEAVAVVEAAVEVEVEAVAVAVAAFQVTNDASPDDDAPDEFTCPITHELMNDPVMACDGKRACNHHIMLPVTTP